MVSPHPQKKNNNTDGKIRAGNKERRAVTTGTAQKRARETGMGTNSAGICTEAKEAWGLVKKVRWSGKAPLHSQLFWYLTVDGTAEFPWAAVFLGWLRNDGKLLLFLSKGCDQGY